MTLTPFRGKCHTCGHDHDAEGKALHDILRDNHREGQSLLAEVERLQAEQQSWRQKERRAVREAIEAVADCKAWRSLYERAINEANGLTNYIEERPELRRAERNLTALQVEARDLAARKDTP